MKMSLNKTWTECLKMWKWIIEKKRRKICTETAVELKRGWVEKHYPNSYIISSCFFCNLAHDKKSQALFINDLGKTMCDYCPGRLVDSSFDCRHEDYHYAWKPKKFYKKLVELNKKRLKK